MIAAAKRILKLRAVDTGSALTQLAADGVPYTEEPCRDCTDPCLDHESYPPKFDVDTDSQLFGTVKPYHKQCIISTGMTDWERDVTDVKGSLAAILSEVDSSSKSTKPDVGTKSSKSKTLPGSFQAEESTRLSILNGSHRPNHEDADFDSVLVMPDFKLVNVPRNREGAMRLWTEHLKPGTMELPNPPETAGTVLQAWVLPYECVILLCSHKRRDNRCAIAAPQLARELEAVLHREGWEVYSQLDDADTLGPPLSSSEDVTERRRNVFATSRKRALLLNNSHMGGHKFAGNMIISTATGSGIWYGRVTPHNIEPIVQKTIKQGQIFPELLRGGVNLGGGCQLDCLTYGICRDNVMILLRENDNKLKLSSFLESRPRVVLIPLCTFMTGFMLGLRRGARVSSLRFLAENAHRAPRTLQGWYLYKKTKNYHVMWGALRGGLKDGLKVMAVGILWVSLEEGSRVVRAVEPFREIVVGFGTGLILSGAGEDEDALAIAQLTNPAAQLPWRIASKALLIGTGAGALMCGIRHNGSRRIGPTWNDSAERPSSNSSALKDMTE